MFKFPTKIEENHRMHARHFALKHVCKGNFTSPIKENIKAGFKILVNNFQQEKKKLAHLRKIFYKSFFEFI